MVREQVTLRHGATGWVTPVVKSMPPGYDAVMKQALKHIWHTGREYLTHWMVAGAILAATGAAPEHWLADLLHDVHLPTDALHLWTAGIDLRVVIAGLGLVLIVGDIAWRRTRPAAAPASSQAVAVPETTSDALPLPDKPSIAVLPFDNLSGDPDQEYFSDGVADDIITELSRDHALFVIARNSSFTYRDRSIDVKQVGRELGVRYVVGGTVRRADGRMRISTQLIDAMTGDHVWAERYDRAVEDVFAVQDEIAAAVATTIRPALGAAEQRRVLRKAPNSLSAWETYQRGLWHMSKVTPTENEQARLLFRQAVEIDPGLASAYVGLVLSYLRDTLFFGKRSPAEAGNLSAVEARKAIAIDPNDSEVHAALAAALCFQGSVEACIQCAERAVALNQNSAFAHWAKSGLIFAGHTKEGRDEATLSLRLNPRDPISPAAGSIIAMSFYIERDYAATIKAARRNLADYPTFSASRRFLVAGLAQLGHHEEAVAELRNWIEVAPDVVDATVRNRFPWVSLEMHEHLIEGLRKAGWKE